MQTALLLSRRRFRSSSLLYRYRVSRLPFSSSKPDNKNDEDVNVIKKAWRVIIRDKHIYTIPNAITMSRICASPFLAVAVATDMKLLSLGGCIIFCFSDWLDGYLAQKLHQRTILGAFLDPLADKCMVASLTVGLCWKGLMPLPLTCLIVGRDLVLTGITFAIRAKERAPGAPFFDTKDSATFDITPSLLSKVSSLSFIVYSFPPLVTCTYI